MTSQRLRLFIVSSYLSRDIPLKLKLALENTTLYEVHLWEEEFSRDVGTHYDEVVRKQLRHADFVIVILAPDARYTVQTERGAQTFGVPTDNMLFELGFTWGLLGPERVIIVRLKDASGETKLPSDLKGITTIDSFSVNDLQGADSFEWAVKKLRDAITTKLPSIRSAKQQQRIPWLSLINSKFGRQGELLKKLKAFATQAHTQWGAEVLEEGVVWGPPDNFLLYTTPSVDSFVEMVTAVRRQHSNLVRAVDSRMVFPRRFWHEAPDRTAESSIRPFNHLVMLSCHPSSVEPVFQKIQGIAQDERGTAFGDEVNITTVGILTGESDLFFITSSRTVEAHHRIIRQGIHRIIMEDFKESEWADFTNTNSLLITRDENEI